MIIEDGGATNAATIEPLLERVLGGIIAAVSELLRREHLKDNLDTRVAWAEGTLQQHPELRGIIRHACQTRSFSHIADLDIFQKPQAQASDPRARSNQDEDRSYFLYDPDVDSEDINCVSQMFISDKAGKNCNEQALGASLAIMIRFSACRISPTSLPVTTSMSNQGFTLHSRRKCQIALKQTDVYGSTLLESTTPRLHSWANIPKLRVICMGLSLGKRSTVQNNSRSSRQIW